MPLYISSSATPAATPGYPRITTARTCIGLEPKLELFSPGPARAQAYPFITLFRSSKASRERGSCDSSGPHRIVSLVTTRTAQQHSTETEPIREREIVTPTPTAQLQRQEIVPIAANRSTTATVSTNQDATERGKEGHISSSARSAEEHEDTPPAA